MPTPKTSPSDWHHALAQVHAGTGVTSDAVVTLLESDPDQCRELFALADAVRHRHVGDGIHLRGLIEFSNHCKRGCTYCGLRGGNRKLPRFRMTLDEIVDCARQGARMGFKSLVLQSGEDPWLTIDWIEDLIRAVKAAAGVALTLSIGEWSREDYRRMRQAGADRFLIKHETADEDLYRALHPGSRFSERLQCLKDLKAEGFQVGSGCMVGLPGQTLAMLARDVLLFKELDVDMVGIGPFIPNPDTPLGTQEIMPAAERVALTLKMVAVTRILTKDSHMPATTALTTLDPLGREKAWQAGANVVMPLLTPMSYREHYQIYPDKVCLKDDPTQCWGCLNLRIAALGRHVAEDPGHRIKERLHA